MLMLRNITSLLSGVLLFGLVATADAAYRCVPTRVSTACPVANVYATVQSAVDAALPNDIVYVGPGTASERLVVDKPLRMICKPGALLTDNGLEPGDYLIQYNGDWSNFSQLKDCSLEVVTSEHGIYVSPTVAWFRLENSDVTRIGDRTGIGMTMDGSERSWIIRSTLRGFDVGALAERTKWLDSEQLAGEPIPTYVDNNIGLWCRNCSGQIFYNRFNNNVVGLRMDGPDEEETWVGQLDINSNKFNDNEVAVLWGLGAKNTEFNHNDLLGNDVAFKVEQLDHTYVEGDTAYHAIIGCNNQFGDVMVNGVIYDVAAFNTGTANCP